MCKIFHFSFHSGGIALTRKKDMGGGVANIIHQKKIHQKGVTLSKKFTKKKKKKHIVTSIDTFISLSHGKTYIELVKSLRCKRFNISFRRRSSGVNLA
jgi:hypothetical protein